MLLGALLRDSELPGGVDLLIDCYLQNEKKQTIVELEIIDLANQERLWSQRFYGEHEDPYELQQQMASGMADRCSRIGNRFSIVQFNRKCCVQLTFSSA